MRDADDASGEQPDASFGYRGSLLPSMILG
jgi:hypothetical protein